MSAARIAASLRAPPSVSTAAVLARGRESSVARTRPSKARFKAHGCRASCIAAAFVHTWTSALFGRREMAVTGDALRALQAPGKERYRTEAGAAMVTLRARGRLGEGGTCAVETGKALVAAGLHPATGGDGRSACSGDMLLEALVACAGVTLNAVASAMGIELRDAFLQAEGDLDFRGTLGLAKDVPVALASASSTLAQ